MQCSTILLGLAPAFGTKIGEKSALELEDLENRKTLQNIAWASKNQGLASQKTMKNRRRKASDGDSEKKRLKNAKKAIFGAPGPRFGSPKRKIFADFSIFSEPCFATPWAVPANRPESAGRGVLGLSPWSSKWLGLLSLSLCLSVSLLIAPRRPNPPTLVLKSWVPQMVLKASFLDDSGRSVPKNFEEFTQNSLKTNRNPWMIGSKSKT